MATRRSSTSRRQQQQQQHVPQQQQVPQQRNDLVVADADVDGLLAELNELDVGLFCVALGAAWYFAYRDERSMVTSLRATTRARSGSWLTTSSTSNGTTASTNCSSVFSVPARGVRGKERRHGES